MFLPLWAKLNQKPIERPIGGTFQWKDLSFPTRVGLAGGVDKSGKSLKSWQALGAGFLEVGTVTPKPQKPNPGTIMKRSLKHWALWNKMGFPSPGMDVVRRELEKFSHQKKVPLFVNIGKNRDTPNENAFDDYSECFEALAPFADGIVVNVSSPNTKNLRELQKGDSLGPLVESLNDFKNSKNLETPILLKLSPDLSTVELEHGVSVSRDFVQGYILTNTTRSRIPGCGFPEEGGMSGAPLGAKSLDALKKLVSCLGPDSGHLIVSVGGVSSQSDVESRFAVGADLVQVYSSLVFHGPNFFQNLSS